MSKTLNDERHVTALRRELTKPKPATDPTPPASSPTPAPTQLAPPAPAATAVLEREPPATIPEPRTIRAEPAAETSPAAPVAPFSAVAVRSAHRRYTLLTSGIAFGVTLGIIAIVRHGRQPFEAMVHRLLPAAVAPPASAGTGSSPLVTTVTPLVPHVRTPRDPFIGAVAPEPEDAALAEAQRVYSLMEAALRDAARTIPAPQTEPATPSVPVPSDRLNRD